MKKIGFCKKEQGIFDSTTIAIIKENIMRNIPCQLIDVDFRDSVIINNKIFVGDLCLNDLDVYFWHDTVHPRDWHADNYFLHTLSVLEHSTKVINTSTSTRIVNDKFLSHLTLKQSGVPVCEFALVRADDRDGLRKAFFLFGEDVLLKPRFGGWGIGIARVRTIDDLFSVVEYMLSFTAQPHNALLIEKFHANDLSRWISVVMFNQKVLFGYKKPLIGDAEWKIYDPQKIDGKGRLSEYVNPPQEAINIAIAAQKAIGKDIVGFDLIYTKDGYKVIDENGRPGLYRQCLDAAHIDIAHEITSLIISKLE